MADDTPRTPKKSETLEVRIPWETKLELAAACREDNTTASEVVRQGISDYLARRQLAAAQTPAPAAPVPQPQTAQLLTLIPPPMRKKRYLVAGIGAIGLAAAAALPSAAADSRSTFSQLDTNKDGKLSPQEFAAARRARPDGSEGEGGILIIPVPADPDPAE